MVRGKTEIDRQYTRDCWDPEECIYYGRSSCTCDYYIITGKRRPCKAGKGCTERVLKTDVQFRRSPLDDELKLAPLFPPNSKRRGTSKLLGDKKAAALYDEGLSDEKIAKQMGVAKSTVQAWRKNTKRPANHVGKKAKGKKVEE